MDFDSTFIKGEALDELANIVLEKNPHKKQTLEKIKKILEKKGIIIGNGYGLLKDSQVRITNFPALSRKDIENLLQSFASI